TVTSSPASSADTATTVTITGANFNPTPANNTVLFNLGATGHVTLVTGGGTVLTVAIDTPPTALGALSAIVTTNGNASSGNFTQVATVINGTWTVTSASSGA